jgi:hypothetical protein
MVIFGSGMNGLDLEVMAASHPRDHPGSPGANLARVRSGRRDSPARTGGQCRLNFPRFLLPPPERVMAIIRDGAFRSCRIMDKGCASVRFVWWSGGLGNRGNALPRCQLQNLSQLPRNIRTSVEVAKPSRGHQDFLPGVVDWMMSPLEYLPKRDATLVVALRA